MQLSALLAKQGALRTMAGCWRCVLMLQSASRSWLYWTPQQLEAGPIAVLKLHASVPHGLHGNWAEEYLGPL